MQEAAVVLSVLRERGRKGLPLTQLYRQMFNKNLYLLAYGNVYSNQGAMTPAASEETADGMSEGKIDQIVELMRRERFRFSPARRVYIPKKNGSSAPWDCRRGRTSGSARWSASCWRRTMSRAFLTGRTDSGKDADATPHCGKPAIPGSGPCGLSRVTSPTASVVSATRSFSEYWRRKSTISGFSGWSVTCSKPGTWRTGNTATHSAEFRKAAYAQLRISHPMRSERFSSSGLVGLKYVDGFG
jgi:hypothetical protein